MGWPIVRRGPGGSGFHVETEFDHGFGGEIPIRIVCDLCGEARVLSTVTAVVVADADWVEQSEAFRQYHRCEPAA